MITEYAAFDKLIGSSVGNYRLEQLVGQGNGGPVFLARTDAETYLLHILAGPATMAPRDRQVYLERFQHQAGQIATLQHPNILPLLDYGSYHGLPYLVSPYLPIRSLHTRLEKNGPLDIFTIGRYLDQIAATLEYAHQHAMLHTGLSVDCIYIRLDGQLVVADFGVRSLLLMGRGDLPGEYLDEWSGACAPEQLLGKPVGTYTDVYALGLVLFALLTGSPVFSGNTPEEIAQQHLYASVPPLSRWRNDLPAGLYSIIARALAKDPVQRFRQPGALANAYHRNVAPNNRIRVPFVVSSTPAGATEEPFTARSSPADAQYTERQWSNGRPGVVEHDHYSQHQAPQVPHTPFPQSLPGVSDIGLPDRHDARAAALLHRFQRKNARRNALIVVLIVLLVVASSATGIALLFHGSNPSPRPTAQVMFFEDQNGPSGYTDALTIAANGLSAPPAGFQYAAWLINEKTEEVVALGTLTARNQSFSLNYLGGNGTGHMGTNLLAADQKLEITLEQGTVKLPAGKAILGGTFPPQAFAHIQHLLVSFPATPGKIGVLVGSLQQTHLLNVEADVLQNLTTGRNPVATQCAAQSLINLIDGKKGPHYQPLAATCALQQVTMTGDGFGLLGNGYLADAAEHATLAISQPDATNTMRLHARLMAIALSNIKGWVTTIEQDALYLLKNPTDLARVQEIVKLADNAYHGVDVNGDGQIDPVPGEAGALTAYLQGQLMATLPLTSTA